jgi:Zn-dependent alcohol dehydrogenase
MARALNSGQRASGQLAVFFLLPRAGAVLNVVKSAAEQSIAVYGGRRVGLAGLMAVRIAGCDPIIVVDPLPSRLVLARELGATREDFTRDLRQLVMKKSEWKGLSSTRMSS